MLRMKLMREGMFESNLLQCSWRVVWTTGIFLLAWWVLAQASGSWFWELVSAFLLGLFWQQSGWLAHDIIHARVFRHRWLNHSMALLVANVYQGFSIGWWKSKHNTHHAIPNTHPTELGKHDGDPDIDTMPLFAWSRKMGMGIEKDSAIARILIVWQAVTYLPVLCLARMSWLQQSVAYAFQVDFGWSGADPLINPAEGILEPICVSIHLLWVPMYILSYCSWWHGLVYFGCSMCVRVHASTCLWSRPQWHGHV